MIRLGSVGVSNIITFRIAKYVNSRFGTYMKMNLTLAKAVPILPKPCSQSVF